MKDKIMTLEQAVSIINDGDYVALGGNVLHRSPLAACREIVRQRKKDLKIIKTAGAMDVDILCAGDCVSEVNAGFISYETEFGLASYYRRAVENGKVRANEHACYTIISALRAAAYNIPFMPVYGLKGSELIDKNNYFELVQDPFSGQYITVVKALKPDVAIIHVQESDKYGNARIYGPKYEDFIISRAAKKLIITTEKIIHTNAFQTAPEKTDFPYFLVSAVVQVRGGAKPGTCAKYYNLDKKDITIFKSLKEKGEFNSYMEKYINHDHCYRKKAGV